MLRKYDKNQNSHRRHEKQKGPLKKKLNSSILLTLIKMFIVMKHRYCRNQKCNCQKFSL